MSDGQREYYGADREMSEDRRKAENERLREALAQIRQHAIYEDWHSVEAIIDAALKIDPPR